MTNFTEEELILLIHREPEKKDKGDEDFSMKGLSKTKKLRVGRIYNK